MKPFFCLLVLMLSACGQCKTSPLKVTAVIQARTPGYTGACTGDDYGIEWSNGDEGCWPPDLVIGPTEYTKVGDTKDMCTEGS